MSLLLRAEIDRGSHEPAIVYPFHDCVGQRSPELETRLSLVRTIVEILGNGRSGRDLPPDLKPGRQGYVGAGQVVVTRRHIEAQIDLLADLPVSFQPGQEIRHAIRDVAVGVVGIVDREVGLVPDIAIDLAPRQAQTAACVEKVRNVGAIEMPPRVGIWNRFESRWGRRGHQSFGIETGLQPELQPPSGICGRFLAYAAHPQEDLQAVERAGGRFATPFVIAGCGVTTGVPDVGIQLVVPQ